MHPSLIARWTRAVPITSVPASALRLPPASSRPRPKATPIGGQAASPTIDRLLQSVDRSTHRLQRQAGTSAQFLTGGGAAAAAGEASTTATLPPNLRINEFVPRRKVYEGVKASHRDLLRRLRREA
ncbi:hypothetical protein BMF94_4048 [Rhodotorula taiwanensis]|uniref:Uncharacterized protein n=1 Tax=Rhodotorula taiwanensis TaxID=741276 RepID=A0A2S5B7Z9_9BASI|nr:hypothetical protein BMF94_4048 [Rhodotorula taiwanensis]